MRTTLTIEDDVAARLDRIRREQDASLEDLVNEALRAGLQEIEGRQRVHGLFTTRAVEEPRQLIPSVDNIAEIIALAEGEAFK